MMMYGGVQAQHHLFLTSILYGDEWSASRPGYFTLTEWDAVGPAADQRTGKSCRQASPGQIRSQSVTALPVQLTLRLLMSYIYIYIYIYMELLVKPEMLTSYVCVYIYIYIYIYMDLRLATLKQSLSICCTMFQH